MPNFKDLGSDIISGVASGVGGPLGDLFNNQYSTTSLNFPADVEGPGQRHFIRFNITTIKGSSFDVSGKNNEQAQQSASGEFLGGLAGGAISDAIGGPLGGLAGGLGADIASNVLAEIGIDTLADNLINSATSLVGEAVSGIATTVESTVGKLSEQASKFKDTVVEKVPIAEDALNGIGSFAGSIGGIAEDFSEAIGGEKKTEADIILYMPFTLNETYQANWVGGEMGLIGALGGVIEASVAAGNFDAISQQMSMSNVKGAAAEIGGDIAGNVLGNENIKKKLLKEQGKSINPHWELFFEGVQPRTFSFDFKLSPRNGTESDAIQQIIQTFKTYAAPPASVDGSARYWGYPSFFEIEYWNTERLHKLKPCALTNITVNYAGDGTNHTFYDGSPIQTDLTMTFMESELLTRQDMQAGF